MVVEKEILLGADRHVIVHCPLEFEELLELVLDLLVDEFAVVELNEET